MYLDRNARVLECNGLSLKLDLKPVSKLVQSIHCMGTLEMQRASKRKRGVFVRKPLELTEEVGLLLLVSDYFSASHCGCC